ncbi:MAG TPA: hypothetical protein IAA43_00650 [Candidatus Olsenella avicola]|nr:hypothetical protein [Candidatus Olsenella avicola]
MRRAAAPTRIRLENTPPLVPVPDRYRCNGRLAVLLYEEEPEEGDDGLWCDLTVNLPQHGLPGDDWAFVPAERLPYTRALEGEGLAEVGAPVTYGGFGQVARVVRFDTSLCTGA